MIVRERPESYVLIEQHEHGLISGEFARHLSEGTSTGSVLYAIANHDLAWRPLDATVLWDTETGKPYSFTSYPIGPRLQAYEEGLNLLETRDPYAACLCSMHYASLVGDPETEEEVAFREGEDWRQRKLRGAINAEEADDLDRNLNVLQLCDDLSLFVCLNEPGRNEHPWYTDGIRHGETEFTPIWEDEHTLRLDPNPFSEPFGISVPYTLLDKDGESLGDVSYGLRVTC